MSSAIIVASRYAIPPLDQYGPGFRHTQEDATFTEAGRNRSLDQS